MSHELKKTRGKNAQKSCKLPNLSDNLTQRLFFTFQRERERERYRVRERKERGKGKTIIENSKKQLFDIVFNEFTKTAKKSSVIVQWQGLG